MEWTSPHRRRQPASPSVGRDPASTETFILDAKRRLTVPSALAPASPGDYFDARFDPEEDAIVFRRLPAKENWLAVLRACPVSMDDVWAEQEHLLEKAGRRMPVEDSYIAATAKRQGLTIVTGNDKDFRRPGLKVFNPFEELSSGSQQADARPRRHLRDDALPRHRAIT
jgi:hypothetical protein